MNETIPHKKYYDVIIIGAGICGTTFLKYAHEQGLHCLILEKQNDVGGLWKWLPAWQDIQNRTTDFAINNVHLDGEKQPSIYRYVRNWITKYELSPFIKLNCAVTSVSWNGTGWEVNTKEELLHARYIIAATGIHNTPWIPGIERSDPQINEIHSSSISRPEDLAGKRVTVVGGGASGWDLLDLSIQYGAKHIHWVYRNTRWFLPSTQSKQTNKLNSLRMLGRAQTVMKSSQAVSAFVQKVLKKEYRNFGLTDIQPPVPFDLNKHQVNPGRPLMIKHLNTLERYRSEIMRIQGREIVLKNGERFETDVLLWGTGYRMDLSYLGLPEFNDVKTLNELYPKLGSLIRSTNYPSLFFIGMSLLESTSSTPFFAAVEAKSIVAHILGKCDIPMRNLPHHVAYWDLFKLFAQFDRYNYPRYWWKIKYFILAWWYYVFPRKLVKV